MKINRKNLGAYTPKAIIFNRIDDQGYAHFLNGYDLMTSYLGIPLSGIILVMGGKSVKYMCGHQLHNY